MHSGTHIKHGLTSVPSPWKTMPTPLELAPNLSPHQHLHAQFSVLTRQFLPISTVCSGFSSCQSSFQFEISMRINDCAVGSQHIYCYEEKLNHSLYLCIIITTSLSLQTSCKLISLGFYIYFPPLSDLCLAYIFEILLKTLPNFG